MDLMLSEGFYLNNHTIHSRDKIEGASHTRHSLQEKTKGSEEGEKTPEGRSPRSIGKRLFSSEK